MRTRFVEATQDAAVGFNHGKFMVAMFDTDEWLRHSEMDLRFDGRETRLIARTGWTPAHVLVLDLETGEGAMFLPGGSPEADLEKHRVWVCPMFEPFLAWLYQHIAGYKDYSAMVNPLPLGGWFEELPSLVELPDAEPAAHGYRRPGPEPA